MSAAVNGGGGGRGGRSRRIYPLCGRPAGWLEDPVTWRGAALVMARIPAYIFGGWSALGRFSLPASWRSAADRPPHATMPP